MDDKQYLENICTLIKNSVANKINEFQQAVMKNDKFNDPYELNNKMLHKNFFIKIFEEINQELKKNNRQFRIDFDNSASHYFH